MVDIKKELYESGKIKRMTVSMSTKVNLGNYESSDLSLSYTVDEPSQQDEANVFDILRMSLMEQEVATKAFLKEKRGR
ncbi:MAG: hypothetical protein PHX51_08595 [Clostridia bacterium]|nr:hypothetical protein [Clostridia bacterium]